MNTEKITLDTVWAELSDYQIRAYKYLPPTLYAGIRKKYGSQIADQFEKEYNALKNTDSSDLVETMIEMNKDYRKNPEAWNTQKGKTLRQIEINNATPTENNIANMIRGIENTPDNATKTPDTLWQKAIDNVNAKMK